MNNYDEEIYEDGSDDINLDAFTLPPEADMSQYGMVLHILGPGGSIDEIMFDIEEIYNYVKNVYKSCPKRN